MGIPLVSYCGGKTTCGGCKIRVVSGSVSPISENEKILLNEEEIATGYRLACAMRVMSDLKLNIPPDTLAAVQRLQLFGKEPKLSLDPVISVFKMKLQEPSLENPLADWENLCKNLEELYGLKNLEPDFSLLRDLSSILRTSNWKISVVIRGNEVIGVCPHDQEMLGIAIDLGTTKIAVYLVNLHTGETLTAKGVMNPQIAYGEDIMSRISYLIEKGDNILQKSVLDTLNNLVREMTGNSEIVEEMTIVGNTAMHHLILGLPVKQLGRAPYVPTICRSLDVKACDIGFKVARGAYIHLLPNVAGFVGADHVAMLLATEIFKTDKNVVGIDIGTNTEVALATRGTITSLSCASGPAFEGAGIKNGMRAGNGAIERIQIDNDKIHFEVIGDLPPIGICGSGILDLIAQLREHQIIDKRGRLQDHPLVRSGVDGRELVLAFGNDTKTGQDIVVIQHDIGEIQLAKAAIRTGINVLLSEQGVSEEKIDEVIIAGAFGSYIDVTSAIKIGMFPSIPLDRFCQVGNAAGVGAKLALISKKNRIIAEEIANRVKYIELSVHPKFTHEFSRSLLFP